MTQCPRVTSATGVSVRTPTLRMSFTSSSAPASEVGNPVWDNPLLRRPAAARAAVDHRRDLDDALDAGAQPEAGIIKRPEPFDIEAAASPGAGARADPGRPWFAPPTATQSRSCLLRMSRATLRIALVLCGFTACATLREGRGGASSFARARSAATLVVLTLLLCAMEYMWIANTLSYTQLPRQLGMATAIFGTPVVLFCSWRMVYKGHVHMFLLAAEVVADSSDSRAAAGSYDGTPARHDGRDGGPQASLPGGGRVAGSMPQLRTGRGSTAHAFDLVPMPLLVTLAMSISLQFVVNMLYTVLLAFELSGGTRTASRFALGMFEMWTAFLCAGCTIACSCAVLASHALRIARRIHALEKQLPQWPTARVLQAVADEQAMTQRRMQPLSVGLQVATLSLAVVFSVCTVAATATGARNSLIPLIGSMLEAVLFFVQAFTTLHTVAEVTERWRSVMRVLYATPEALDPERAGLGKRLYLQWQEGLLGLSVFGVVISRASVRKGLCSVGTLLGVLVRLGSDAGSL